MGWNSKNRTDGGVTKHAIERVKKQYGCKLSEGTIKKILREAKNGNTGENGFFTISPEHVNRLGIELPPSGMLVGIIARGSIVTVEDKL